VREVEPPLPAARISVHACGPMPGIAQFSPNQRRRLNRLTQMALVAARRGQSLALGGRKAVAIGTGLGCLEEGAIFIENMLRKDEQEPMPARFPGSVHNAIAAQVAIDLGARGLNAAPTAGEISFECALWQGVRQLAIGEVDSALAGAADELNKYPLSIGQRWGIWTDRILPGEGVVLANLVRAETPAAADPLVARISALRLGRYRRPFDAERETNWIGSIIKLSTVNSLVTGEGGSRVLDPMYTSLTETLSRRTRPVLEHRTYKHRCGEYPSASGFGFSVALELLREGRRAVLLCTLGWRGAKAFALLEPGNSS